MTPVLAVLLLSATGLAEGNAAVAPPPAAPASGPPAAAPPAARILALDPRLEAYDQFRAFFEQGRYQDALPYAQRVVELSESDPSRDHELPIAYNNLGATQFYLGEYAAAETSYKRSLEILEATQGISSRRLIVPLAGLGAVYAALDQHAMATERFERALAVSRRAEGLFNLGQLPLLEHAADSRLALGDLIGVENERFYALRVAEQNYGYGDQRTVQPALRLARFYEDVQQYGQARSLYLRVRDVAMAESGGLNPLAIRTLIAICRTHRLQFTLEPDTIDDAEPVRDPLTGQLVPKVYRSTQVPVPGPQADRAGLKSAERALEILRAAPDPPADLLIETLTELGDWFQATERSARALPYYVEAVAVHARHPDSGLMNPLSAPRMIFYREPLASKRGAGAQDTGDTLRRTTAFEFTVTENGEARDIKVISTDMKEGQLVQSRRALARAIYSPRFENGQPVATEGVRFIADWYDVPVSATPPSTTPEQKPASESAPSAPGS